MADIVAARLIVPVNSNATGTTAKLKLLDDQISKTIRSSDGLRSKFAALDRTAALLGNKAEVAARKQAILKAKIEELVSRGVNPANKGIQKLVRQYNQLNAAANRGNGILRRASGALGALVPGASIAGLALLIRSLVRAASDAEETRNKFNVVFSGIQQRAEQTAQTLARDFALSGEEAQRLLSNTGDLLAGFGATQTQALDLSSQVQTLAADLASFNNVQGGTQAASEALTAAMLGERERLKSLGIVISETAVQQEVMSAGQGALTGEARLLARAQATLRLAVRQSGNAIGDFARSQNSAANVARALGARLKDAAVAIGRELLPGLTQLGIALRNSENIGGGLITILRGIARIAGETAGKIANLVTQLEALSQWDIRGLAEAVFSTAPVPENQRQELLNYMFPGTGTGAVTRQTAPARTTTTTSRTVGGETPQTRGGASGSAAQQIQNEKQLLEEKLFMNKEFLRRKAEADRQAEEERIQKARETFSSILDVASQISSGFSDIFSMAASNEIQMAENAYKRKKALIEANVEDEDQRAALLAQIAAQKDAEVARIEREAAKRQKQIAIFETIISTATAAMGAYRALAGIPYVGPALGAAAAIAVTAIGAAKVALIQSQPLPTAQYGGDFIVPPGNGGDSGAVAVNSGERVSVTPVRHSGSETKSVIVKIGSAEFRGYLQEEINTAINSGNVQSRRKGFIKTA